MIVKMFFFIISASHKSADEEGGRKRGRDQAEAESHYDSLKRNKDDRFRSRIFHLRNLNNWVKVNHLLTIHFRPVHLHLKVKSISICRPY